MAIPPGYFSGQWTTQDIWDWIDQRLAEVKPEEARRVSSDPCFVCPPESESVFDRVTVSYLLKGGTQVAWELQGDFTDPDPYVFQLQAGRTANNRADDWEDVGGPIINQFYAVDGQQRIFGKTNYTHYRVKLITANGEYISEPVGLMGTLARRDWRLARDVLRKERIRMEYGGQEGLLLKRRISGQRCTQCTDHQTGEVRDPNCENCYGTGFECGYYYPIACVWADLSPKTHHLNLKGSRGPVNDIAVSGRMINTWMMSEEDVWVNRKTDERYYAHKIQNVAEMRGIPLVAQVELRPAPATDIIYEIPLPQQEDALEG